MSDPPPPYPPASSSPYGAPGPPPGPSNKARFWIGVLLAIPYVVVGSR